MFMNHAHLCLEFIQEYIYYQKVLTLKFNYFLNSISLVSCTNLYLKSNRKYLLLLGYVFESIESYSKAICAVELLFKKLAVVN